MIDESKADKVRQFCKQFCTQSKAPFHGKPLDLLPWQWQDIVLPLYGTVDEQGNRQFKRCGIWVCKKVGKSTLCAALGLYHLLEQPGSEVYVIAANVMQANIVFSQAADFVELHPALRKRLWVRRNIKTIEDQKAKSVFRVLSSEPDGKSGISPTCLIMDELAEWPRATARDTWDKLYNASIARRNWLHISISTAQYDKTHLGYEQYLYAKQVKEGTITDATFLPVIYSLDEQADWTDPNNWWKVCPSLDVTVPRESYHEDYQTVLNDPIQEARFRTFRLCQWVGSSEQWIASNVWAACSSPVEEMSFAGQSCWVGIDYASRGDLCAYSLVFERDNLLYCFPRFFIPASNAYERERRDNVPYRFWASNPANRLTLTEGERVNPQVLIDSLCQDSKVYKFKSVGFDPYGLEVTRQELEFKHKLPMVEVPQSPQWIVPPTNLFHRRVIAGELKHPNNPILNWNLGNCKPKNIGEDAVKIDKRGSTARVDGITSCIIALNRYLADQEKPKNTFTKNFVRFI